MTDDDAARAAFKADQEAAAQEALARDEVTWRLGVDTAKANVEMKRAHAKHALARAELWEALANLVWAFLFAACIVGVSLAIKAVVGWFA